MGVKSTLVWIFFYNDVHLRCLFCKTVCFVCRFFFFQKTINPLLQIHPSSSSRARHREWLLKRMFFVYFNMTPCWPASLKTIALYWTWKRIIDFMQFNQNNFLKRHASFIRVFLTVTWQSFTGCFQPAIQNQLLWIKLGYTHHQFTSKKHLSNQTNCR